MKSCTTSSGQGGSNFLHFPNCSLMHSTPRSIPLVLLVPCKSLSFFKISLIISENSFIAPFDACLAAVILANKATTRRLPPSEPLDLGCTSMATSSSLLSVNIFFTIFHLLRLAAKSKEFFDSLST